MKDLSEFLAAAELQQYCDSLQTQLKVTNISQLKSISDQELISVGMTKPEVRRLRQFFKKECPQGAFSKLRKILVKTSDNSNNKHIASNQHLISEDELTVSRTIGMGEFGVVQQGLWTGHQGLQQSVSVAIKCLSKVKISVDSTQLITELTALCAIEHPHLVQLYGLVVAQNSYMLVYELASLRSLCDCLKRPPPGDCLGLSTLCQFAVQIADAMAYLETRKLVHRGLAAKNVLVFATDKVKVSDYGLHRAIGCQREYYQNMLTSNLKSSVAWCSPESIKHDQFTSASDVWSFGVTLWEMFSGGDVPWSGLNGKQILEAVDTPRCSRLSQPVHCPDDWYDLMLKCWKSEPAERPKFSEMFLVSLPQLKPLRVCGTKHSNNNSEQCLQFAVGDIITVLSKTCKCDDTTLFSSDSVWKGLVEATNSCGLFDPASTVPYLEISSGGTLLRSGKVLRTESARLSFRPNVKLRASMIGRPENDLRHIGHVGYDGAVFGDVSFFGDDYNKTKNNDNNSFASNKDEMTSSCISLPLTSSQFTRSDNRMTASLMTSCDTDDIDELEDFQLPDLSIGLDLGMSFMDEVMKALNMASPSAQQQDAATTSTPAAVAAAVADSNEDENEEDEDTETETATDSDGDDTDTCSASTETDEHSTTLQLIDNYKLQPGTGLQQPDRSPPTNSLLSRPAVVTVVATTTGNVSPRGVAMTTVAMGGSSEYTGRGLLTSQVSNGSVFEADDIVIRGSLPSVQHAAIASSVHSTTHSTVASAAQSVSPTQPIPASSSRLTESRLAESTSRSSVSTSRPAEFSRQPSTTTTTTTTMDAEQQQQQQRSMNMNIRVPAGIPGRTSDSKLRGPVTAPKPYISSPLEVSSPGLEVTSEVTARSSGRESSPPEVDTNPLRMLRQTNTVFRPPAARTKLHLN